jgi:hypothetical protein
MDIDIEILRIPNCPKCNEPHNYKLRVKRAHVIKMLTMNDMRERPVLRKYTRLFICPSKKENFQATISLQDTSNDRIESVDVIGVDNDE